MKIRIKTLIFFFVFSVVPFLIVTIFGLYSIRQVRDISIAELELEINKNAVKTVQNFLEKRMETYELHVLGEGIKEVKEEQQQYILKQLFVEDDFLLYAAIVDKTGIEQNSLTKGEEEVQKTLKNLSPEPFYKENVQGKNYFGPVVFEEARPTILLAAPIINREQEMIGSLAAKIDLGPIQEQVNGIKLGNKGYVYLIDTKGQIIAVGKNIGVPDSAFNKSILETGAYSRLLSDSLYNPPYLGLKGEEVKGAMLTVPHVGWRIIVEWPTNDAYAVIKTIIYQIPIIIGFLFLLMILIWRLTKPYDAITTAISKVSDGREKGPQDITQKIQNMVASIQRQEKEQYEFITSASHQLRTPASGMRMELELLKEMLAKHPQENEELIELLDTISENNDRSIALINDLLKIIELGRDYQPTETKSVKIKKLVDSILESFSEDVSKKKLTVKNEIPQDLSVKGEETGLKTVLLNLLDNAIAYSNDAGSVTVSGVKNDKAVTITVEDTGIGIPKKEQINVFNTFFRAKNSYGKKSVGTGLGLVIVKRIVEGHSGKIGFESTENKGSKFWFTL